MSNAPPPSSGTPAEGADDRHASLSPAAALEAILFYRGEAVSFAELARLLETSEEEVVAASRDLSRALRGRGLALMLHERKARLRTAPEASALMERVRKEELSKDLGNAGAETLAILLYMGPASRAEVEYVRGVNCAHILRSLMVRGLIERQQERGKRAARYRVTEKFLAHLGVTTCEELPEFHALQRQLKTFAEQRGEEGAR